MYSILLIMYFNLFFLNGMEQKNITNPTLITLLGCLVIQVFG